MSEQIRNIWISGLLDPSKVRMTERYWFYNGDIEKSKEARKEAKKHEKFIRSYLRNQSWRSVLNQGRGRQVPFNWLSNPVSDSISADVTFFERENYKVPYTLFHLF